MLYLQELTALSTIEYLFDLNPFCWSWQRMRLPNRRSQIRRRSFKPSASDAGWVWPSTATFAKGGGRGNSSMLPRHGRSYLRDQLRTYLHVGLSRLSVRSYLGTKVLKFGNGLNVTNKRQMPNELLFLWHKYPSKCTLRYAKTLFLHNSSLSDARLCRIRVNPETRLCFADLSFRVDDRKISSYAAHLKGGFDPYKIIYNIVYQFDSFI